MEVFPTEKSLTELENKVVTLWSWGALVTYAAVGIGVFALVMAKDPQINGLPVSHATESLATPEDTAAQRNELKVTDARNLMTETAHPKGKADGRDQPAAMAAPLQFNNPAGISPFIGSPKVILPPSGGAPGPEVLRDIAAWLSSVFGLPLVDDYPQVELVSQAKLGMLRFRGLASDRQPSGAAASAEQMQNVIALYDDAKQTIYLNQGWTGSNAEMSVLVHEMVHHVQNVAGLKYDCLQGREKLAYEAQARWLEIVGLNLLDEFEIDPLTALVRAMCVY